MDRSDVRGVAGALDVKKILYIVADTGDFMNSRLALARAARDRGYGIHVAAPGARAFAPLKAEGFHGHDLPPLSVLSFARVFMGLGRIAKETRPDIIHAFTLKYALVCGLAGDSASQRVFTIAGLGYLFSGGALSDILRIALTPLLKRSLRGGAIIVQNPDDQAAMTRFAAPGAIHLIRGSGVDLRKFFPRPGMEEAPPVVLMPARLLKDKGIVDFIAAARVLKKRGVQARFVVAGKADGANPRALTERAMKEMTADGAAEWIGHVSDMPALYARASIISYPSHYREGVPRALLEAAAYGKPIVTTDHPGCREAVEDGVTGYLVPVKNAEALADKIEQLLRDLARASRMGAAGRAKAEREFNVEDVARTILDLYEGKRAF